MSRIVKTAMSAAVLVVLFAAPSNAALTRTQAEAKAQSVQDGQCGRGSAWLCDGKRQPPSSCLQGPGYWYCNGGVFQISFWGSHRACNVYVTVQSGVATLRDNSCF